MKTLESKSDRLDRIYWRASKVCKSIRSRMESQPGRDKLLEVIEKGRGWQASESAKNRKAKAESKLMDMDCKFIGRLFVLELRQGKIANARADLIIARESLNLGA